MARERERVQGWQSDCVGGVEGGRLTATAIATAVVNTSMYCTTGPQQQPRPYTWSLTRRTCLLP
eukprot:COSAG05_NODE_10893_length_540_cov_1.174603_1_plen_63_part_10